MGGETERGGRAVRPDLQRGPSVRRSAGPAPAGRDRGRPPEARALQGREPGGEALAHVVQHGGGDPRDRPAHRRDPARDRLLGERYPRHAGAEGDLTVETKSEARIVARKDGAIGWLIFDNPARRNAVSVGMWEAIPRVLEDFGADPAI